MTSSDNPTILITGKVFKEIVPMLTPHMEIRQWQNKGTMPLDLLEKEIANADGLILAYGSQLPESVIQKGNRLKIIAQHFVGYEHVDIGACTALGIPFCNTASASANTVAELAMGLIYSSFRNIPACHNYVYRGEWATSERRPFLSGTDLYGSTLGIVGMGRIGLAINNQAQGCGMKVIYHNRRPRTDDAKRNLRFASLDELYAQSDVIVNVLPSTAATKYFFTLNAFKKMKSTALFVNVGRGDTVKTDDLVTALETGIIAQAALDVVDPEPLPANHPLLNLQNLIITPHIGGSTKQTHLRKAYQTAENILNCFSGKPLKDCLNPEVLPHVR